MQITKQSDKLFKLVGSKSNLPRYEIILSPFEVDDIKDIKVRSILDTSYQSLEFYMLHQDIIKAKVKVIKSLRGYKLEIVQTLQKTLKKDAFICSFGYVYSRYIEPKNKLDISSLDLEDIDIKYKAKTIAKGKMVMVDKKASIMITKVCDR